MKKLHNLKKIMLNYDKDMGKGAPIRIETYLLDLYALKKYKTAYVNVANKVNGDIRKIAKEHNTKVTKEVKALIIMELMPERVRVEVMSEYMEDSDESTS